MQPGLSGGRAGATGRPAAGRRHRRVTGAGRGAAAGVAAAAAPGLSAELIDRA